MNKHMKKLITLAALILAFSFYANNAKASHYMGGEISWECKANGKFVFTLKYYRECNGITFNTSLSMASTSPAGNIAMTIVSGWPKDITPECNPDITLVHINCSNVSTNNTGAIMEYVYRSGEIQINGVPPATGWKFYHESGNRNPSTNIQNANSKGWLVRTIMYPFNNQNMYPCYDSSPTFAESPTSLLNAGYPVSFIQAASDIDLDSLYFEWGQPMEDVGIPLLGWAPGYSYQSPFPDTSMNINNSPVILNSQNGNVSLTCYTQGAFVTCIKVSSYKSGVKVAEIYRDFQYVIKSSIGNNLPPIIASPFPNNSNQHIDTVHALDTVRFTIAGSDLQLFPNGSFQNVELKVYGSQLGVFIPPSTTSGSGTMSETTGCLITPCATLAPAPGPGYPVKAAAYVSSNFSWVIDCSHLKSSSGVNNYDFEVGVFDDYCPVPATQFVSVRIVVVGKVNVSKPPSNLSYVYFSSGPTAVLQWSNNQVDSSSFLAYYIYEMNTPDGSSVLIDSVTNYSNTIYDLHSTNVLNQKRYYYIKTKYRHLCDGPSLSLSSDTLPILISGMGDIEEDNHLLVMPNPTTGKFEIETTVLSDVEVKLRIVSVEGKVIWEEVYKLKSGTVRIPVDISTHKKGIYFYELEMNGDKKTGKVLLNK